MLLDYQLKWEAWHAERMEMLQMFQPDLAEKIAVPEKQK